MTTTNAIGPSAKGERKASSRLGRKDVERYYRAAIWGLRRLDDLNVPRPRFSAEADALWRQFQGALTQRHRLDILLREGAVRFGSAFHASHIFALSGLALDEPFGPLWPSLDEQDARDLWNAAKEAPRTEPKSLLVRWIEILDIRAPASTPLATPGPAEQIIAIGPAAARRVWEAFTGHAGLDWARQVQVVAATPAERQFAGLLATLDPASGPTRLLDLPAADADAATWPARSEVVAWLSAVRTRLSRLDRVVLGSLSVPANPAVARAAAEALVGALPGATLVT